MKTWIKCGMMGLTIWVLLFLAFYISDYLVKCSLPTNDSGSPLVGSSCWNSIQELILMIFAVLSFPFLLVGANPNMTTVGPFRVMLFWIGSMISFVLWGMLTGWIIEKILEAK